MPAILFRRIAQKKHRGHGPLLQDRHTLASEHQLVSRR